jgi:hypothetical protein
VVEKAHRSPRSPRAPAKLGLGVALAVALVVTAVAGAAVLLLPTYVKRRAIDEAARRGVALTIDDARIGVGVIHLTGVAFRIGAVPQASGTAGEVDVELVELAPRTIAARDVALTVDGPFEEVSAATDAWLESLASAPASTVEALHVQSGHITWTRAFGMTATMEGSGLTGESDGRGAAIRVVSESTRVSLGPGASARASATALGPWRVTYERDAATARARVDLDPAIRDGASALWVESRGTGATSLKVGIPRSPLARLGIPPAALALAPDAATELEGTIDLERPTPRKASLDAQITLHGARLGGAPMPVDVRLDLGAAGDPEGPLDVTRGLMAVGPLKATVTGTVRLFPDGARVALAWKTAPIACSVLARQLAGQSPLGPAGGDMAARLGTLAEDLGLARVTGEAHAAGLITLDTRNVEGSQVTVTQKSTCGVTIFP